MKFLANNRYSKSSGVALVVTLAMLVLLTIVVMAFFVRATANRTVESSRSNRALAEQVALSGLDYTTSIFLEEIRNNTNSLEMGGGAESKPYFYPVDASTAEPSRRIWTDTIPPGFENLIRQSLPQIDPNSSTDNTASPAPNGRDISPERWSEPILTSSFTGADQIPNWIYIKNDGSVTNSAGADVIGRFAYTVYDIAGLLDINAAGHPSSVSGDRLNEVRGTLAAADLSQIPGITNPDEFVSWRNSATAIDPAAFTTSIGNGFTSGFLIPANGDKRIVNRRDLIRLARLEQVGLTAAALPFLTHFTREVNAPTFSYTEVTEALPSNPFNATSTNAPLPNPTNPSPLESRMSTDGVAPDGFQWEAGDPVVPRRFPLGRLSRIAYDATSSPGSDIHKFFGLLRPIDSGPWTYTSPDLTTPAAGIKTLAQIAALTGNSAREPGFFELLKAAIHRDSIGVQGGDPTQTSENRSYANNQPELDELSDLQILRIGANIIDQADADSYPTTITFTPTLTIGGSPVEIPLDIYGIEDLPYIGELQFRTVLANSPGYPDSWSDPGPNNRRIETQIIPELWNPHRNIASVGNMPENIRFHVTGRTRFVARARSNATTSSQKVDFSYAGPRMNSYGLTGEEGDISDGNPVNNVGYILIPQGSFSNFRDPRAIHEAWASAVSPTSSYGVLPYHTTRIHGVTGAAKFEAVARPPGNTTAPARLDAWDGYFTINPPGNGKQLFLLNPGSSGYGLNAVLSFQDHKGNFHPYTSFVGVADREGRFGTIYDRFGLGGASADSSGLYMWMFHPRNLPSLTGSEWDQNAGNLPAAEWTVRQNHQSRADYYTEKGDPRTSRFGAAGMYSGNTFELEPRHSSHGGYGTILRERNPAMGAANLVIRNNPPNPEANSYFPGLLAANSTSLPSYTYDKGPTPAVQTGRVRPGDDYFNDQDGGLAKSLMNPLNVHASPIVLNRAFRSVGELSYAFRDMPFKSLDFFSSVSADAALSDFFCIGDTSPPLIAGRLGLNSARPEVIKSMLVGTPRREGAPASAISQSEADDLSDFYHANSPAQPLISKAHFVLDRFTTEISPAFPSPKTEREAPFRSLSGVGNTRTWNLFLDVIAQAGRFVGGQFIVEGEDRIWSSVAIDRYKGEIVDENREYVLE